MFGKLIEKLKSLTRSGTSFDPSTLNDPVAAQTEWIPAKGGGANFRTHKLVVINPYRLEFQASLGAKLFYIAFIVIGMAVFIAFLSSRISSGTLTFDMETIMPLFIGLVFACAGGCLFYFGTAPVVFDKRDSYFWKGRKSPNAVFDKSTIKKFARFGDIHALQLISEYCRGNKSSYYSYELNLVLKSNRRINVVDHGSRDKIREQAATLSRFLSKPVWDAIGEYTS